MQTAVKVPRNPNSGDFLCQDQLPKDIKSLLTARNLTYLPDLRHV